MDAPRNGTPADDPVRVAQVRLEIEAARRRIVETVGALEYKAALPARISDTVSGTASNVTARVRERIAERKAARMDRDMARKMETLEQTIEVDAPRSATYDQ